MIEQDNFGKLERTYKDLYPHAVRYVVNGNTYLANDYATALDALSHLPQTAYIIERL